MEPLQADDPPQVGRYRLVGRLGLGGMGRVYAATSPDGRRAAVTVRLVHRALKPANVLLSPAGPA